MAQETVCRICEKEYSPNFANFFDTQVKVHGCENYLISYFEAIQQLTGMEVCNIPFAVHSDMKCIESFIIRLCYAIFVI